MNQSAFFFVDEIVVLVRSMTSTTDCFIRFLREGLIVVRGMDLTGAVADFTTHLQQFFRQGQDIRLLPGDHPGDMAWQAVLIELLAPVYQTIVGSGMGGLLPFFNDFAVAAGASFPADVSTL